MKEEKTDLGPPKDVPASELWARITAMPRPHRLVDFPRIDPATKESVGQIAMWPLTQEEQMVASAEAEKFARKAMKELSEEKLRESFGYETIYSNEASIQVLFRACRRPDNLTWPAFTNPKDMRQKLTADEVGALFRHYLTVQIELGPIVVHLSQDEMEAWIKRLEEGGSVYPFDLLGSETRIALLRFMVHRTYNSLMGISSPGLPQSEEPQSTDNDDLPPSEEQESLALSADDGPAINPES